jgi:hypothetical protein
MRGRNSSVFLVLDGHPAHMAKVVAQYVQRPGVALPARTPELDPDDARLEPPQAPRRQQDAACSRI